MKRTLSILLIALIAMTGIFAENAGFTTSSNPAAVTSDSATSDVTFTLTKAEIEAYSIGFTNQQPNLGTAKAFATGIPEPKNSVTLKYVPASETATNAADPLYFYFKVKAAAAPTITISGTHLQNGAGKRIDYTATAVSGASGTLDTTEGTNSSLAVETSGFENGFVAGFGKLNLETKTPLNASFAADNDPYNGTIVINIAAGV